MNKELLNNNIRNKKLILHVSNLLRNKPLTMKSTILTINALLVMILTVSGQPDTIRKGFKLSGMGIETSNYMFEPANLSNAEWRSMINNPDAFFEDDTFDYANIHYYTNCCDDKDGIWLNFENNKNNNEIHVGFWINNRHIFSFDDSYKENIGITDTLYMDKYMTLIEDSIVSVSIHSGDFYKDISLSVSYLFSTNKNCFVSFLSGPGIESGYTVEAKLITHRMYSEISEREIYTNKSTFPMHILNVKTNTDNSYKETELEKSLVLRPFIPIVLNFRLSNISIALKHINVYLVGRAGLDIQFYPESNKLIYPFYGFGAGLLYKF